jgi:hypothetical protein
MRSASSAGRRLIERAPPQLPGRAEHRQQLQQQQAAGQWLRVPVEKQVGCQ